jgi:hypothetical protein
VPDLLECGEELEAAGCRLAQIGLGWLSCILEHSPRERAEDLEVNIEGGKE